jgi:hypothetical protein
LHATQIHIHANKAAAPANIAHVIGSISPGHVQLSTLIQLPSFVSWQYSASAVVNKQKNKIGNIFKNKNSF